MIFGSCANRLHPTHDCRSVACPAICREPAANPVCALYLTLPRSLALLPLRARSRDEPRSYSLRPDEKAHSPR
jgi:hypothetical protein